MKIYVVSLARAADRRRRITGHLEKMRVPYELFDAIDGLNLSDQDMERLCDMDVIRREAHWMTRGMVGACLSHYNIYKKIVADNIDRAIIIEDDTVLRPDFLQVVESLGRRTDPFVLLHYTSFSDIVLTNRAGLVGDYSIYEPRSCDLNSAAGYLISQDTCRKMIDAILPIRRGPDSWKQFCDENAIPDVKCVYPKPVNIIFAKSTIDYIDHNSAKGKILNLINRFMIPPFFQLLRYRRKKMNQKMDRIRVE